MLNRIAFIALFCFLFLTVAQAQSPKREFRAAWVATVANIDWPSKQGLPAIEQQEQFTRMLDELKTLGCNAVIVQIRPASDALYASSMEPWSHYLTGRQGEPPFPFYDPLIFMIDEAHKRNMEFHAWFNPFRALVDSKKNPNPASHVTYKHPDWIISYGGKSYINPGEPEAREYVIKVITDVVKRYDIDAVHLDDYFYPYRIGGAEFGDARSYAKYGRGMTKDDWRRDNVSLFISQLNTDIKHLKPYVKLGVSPFGIWRNATKDPDGSATRGGQTDYDDLYADVMLWMRKGWVDYLLPQLYWEHHNHAAPFEILLPWWNNHSYGRHVYYGLGLYRMSGSPSGAWAGTNEISSQIRNIRNYTNTGFSFYSVSCFDKARAPIKDTIAKHYDKYPAIPPAMKWLDSVAPAAPVVKIITDRDGALLKWQENNPSKETIRYIVYRFVDNEPVNLERSDRIMSVQNKTEFSDNDANHHRKCMYVVTALDRLWNESKASNVVTTEK